MIVSFESPDNDENWTPSSLASLIAKRQVRGEDVKCLIAPLPIESNNADDDSDNQSCTACHLSPSSKKPKNHLRANRQALKEKQQHNAAQKEARQTKEKLKQQKLEKKKQKLFGNVRSRVASSLSSPSEQSAEVQNIGRGVSSLAASDSTTDSVAFGRKVPIHAQTSHHRPSTNNSCAESVVSSSSSSNSRRHKSYGKVPSYITRRRAKIAEFEEEQRRRDETAPPEPGLVLLEESERIKTLDILKASELEARYELSNIPFSMNPARAGKLREAISFRLKEIEDAILVFSKERVFVAKDG